MEIKYTTFNVAYLKGILPSSILNVIVQMSPNMYNDDGNGQYELEELRDKFDNQSEEYDALNNLVSNGIDYIEV